MSCEPQSFDYSNVLACFHISHLGLLALALVCMQCKLLTSLAPHDLQDNMHVVLLAGAYCYRSAKHDTIMHNIAFAE